MKKVRVEIEQKEINELVGKEFDLFLPEGATIIDAIIKIDKEISAKGKFPIKGCNSLLHMLYNPIEYRMYNHILMLAYSKSEPYINVKYKPELELPDKTNVRIIIKTLCADEAPEKIMDYELFRVAMLSSGYKIS